MGADGHQAPEQTGLSCRRHHSGGGGERGGDHHRRARPEGPDQLDEGIGRLPHPVGGGGWRLAVPWEVGGNDPEAGIDQRLAQGPVAGAHIAGAGEHDDQRPMAVIVVSETESGTSNHSK